MPSHAALEPSTRPCSHLPINATRGPSPVGRRVLVVFQPLPAVFELGFRAECGVGDLAEGTFVSIVPGSAAESLPPSVMALQNGYPLVTTSCR